MARRPQKRLSKSKLKKFASKYSKSVSSNSSKNKKNNRRSSRTASRRIRKKRISKASKKLVFFNHLARLALFGMIIGVIAVFTVFAIYSRELPNPDQLLERNDELSTKLYDRNGEPIFEVYGEKNRILIKFDEIAPSMVHATLAVEDGAFYQHKGFSVRGMIRAFRNTVTGKGLQGGSTLTQQVVKNSVLTQERTLTRKIKEIILALQLESKYNKDQILQMYLNETPYGGQNYGVVTAAKAYFDKHPSELTIAESAYIAGLTQRPSYYSHFGTNPDAGLVRKNTVLGLMNDKGWVGADGKRYYLNDDEYEAALKQVLDFKRGQAFFESPHFTFYVKQVLEDIFGEGAIDQGGMQVTTTLDLELQRAAQEIVKEEIDKAAGLNIGNGALVAVQPGTGHILAMVGSKDYFADPLPEGCISGGGIEDGCVFDPNVNVTIANRQPGSSIKPITYATLLSQGYSASFPFLDVETTFPDAIEPYTPQNYFGTFNGPMPLRKALGNSLNIPAVKALQIAGIDNMIDQAEKMGISTLTDRSRYGLALTLGGGETKLLEMTGAFATFANKGVFVAPTPIIEVKNARGDVIYKQTPVEEQALSEEVAFLISDILSDDGARADAFGAGGLLNIPGHQVAVKTGTTDDLRDNHAVGFTKDIAIGVWVGNSNNAKMSRVASGISGASPLWRKVMIEFLNGKEAHKFEPPETVEKITVDTLTGLLPFEDFPTRPEWFIKGTEPTTPSDWYQRLEVCKKDNKLASDACRDADKTKEKTFIDIQAEFPEWQMDVDAWIGENYSGESQYFPPRMKSALEFDDDGDVKKDTSPAVKIVNFEDGDAAPLKFRLKVEVSSPRDIEFVKIYMDGNEITKDKSAPYGYNFNLSAEQIGEHTFKAKVEDEKGRTGNTEINLAVVGSSF